MNFENIFLLFIEEIKLTTKLSTVAQYYTLATNHILHKFKDKNINNISESELIKHVLDEKGNNLTHKGENLSQKTVCDIIVLINSIFKYAFNKKFIKNKIRISMPKKVQTKVTIFNNDEMTKIREYILNNITCHGIVILLSLYTGLRIGELCALKWGSIDLDMSCYNKVVTSLSKVI